MFWKGWLAEVLVLARQAKLTQLAGSFWAGVDCCDCCCCRRCAGSSSLSIHLSLYLSLWQQHTTTASVLLALWARLSCWCAAYCPVIASVAPRTLRPSTHTWCSLSLPPPLASLLRPSSSLSVPFLPPALHTHNTTAAVGVRGPILLEDYHLVEKLANFDRERIPERVVHARGAAAKGFFEVRG